MQTAVENTLRISCRVKRVTLSVAVSLSAAAFYAAVVRAQPATTNSAMTPAAAERTPQTVTIEFTEATKVLEQLLPEHAILRDPAVREKFTPVALPAVRKAVALLDELAIVGAAQAASQDAFAEAIIAQRMQTEPLLIIFGDKGGTSRISARAGDRNPADAATGRGEQLIANYLLATDEGGQMKVADELEGFLKASKPGTPVDYTAALILNYPAASEMVVDRLLAITKTTPAGDLTDNIRAQIDARRVQKGFENKPLVLEGAQLDGAAFSTAQFKGKVVLVDFWATWCLPCLEELPHVKALYEKHHEEGLEVVGVSSDYSPKTLAKFLSQNKDMPWPQLVDPAAAEKRILHPLATSHGVAVLPVIFVVDRKGILRTVEGMKHIDELIPKLLAEPAE